MTTASSQSGSANHEEECLTEQVTEAEACLEHLARISTGESSSAPAPNAPDWINEAENVWKPQLHMEDSMYRRLLEQLPVVAFVARLGAEHNELYVSPQIETLLGFSQQAWLDNPVLWYERLHPEDKARWDVEFSRFLVLDEPFRSVYRFLAKDGRLVWVRGEVHKIRDEHGLPISIQGIGYDITELKEADEKLRQAHEQLERRVEERTSALAERARELAEANARLQEEMSERQRLEEQLLHAQKMESVGKLAGGVAHDFNNLLTAIMGYNEMARMKLPDEDPAQEDLEQIQKASDRAANLVRQLLAFARKQLIAPKVVSLNALLLNLDPLLRRLIGEDVELMTLPAAFPDRVRIDPHQFEHVIVNLVVNARDAMPEGGKIILETSNVTLDAAQTERVMELTPGDFVLLSVRDTGTGMSEELQTRIFEPFFTTKELGKGTGLGLSTCYGIVKQSKGHIQVQSAPGSGATFLILLPLVEDDAAETPDDRPRRPV